MRFVKKQRLYIHELPLAETLMNLGLPANDRMVTAKAVFHRGFEFRVGEFLLISTESANEDGRPRFGRMSPSCALKAIMKHCGLGFSPGKQMFWRRD